MAVASLLKEGGTHCKTLNGLVRKILLKCHKNGIMLCPEYLRGVPNLQADALSRGKKAQEWSLGDPACHRLFKHWGTPVVDLFTSSQTHKVPQYFNLDLSDKRTSGQMPCWRGGQKALRYAFPSPNIMQMSLGRLVRWGGDQITITPFWQDQSWFPEVMYLAMEPPRRLRPSQWLLWNATTNEAIPKVMKASS